MRGTLNGVVANDDDLWLYNYFEIPAFSPKTVRDLLAANPNGEDLELEINSSGGSAFAGFEIFSVLREAKCRTVAIVQSIAASAASTIAAACETVRMSPVAQIMIHLPSLSTAGNQNDLLHDAAFLESVTQSILNGYEAKCRGKTTREELNRLMHAESWLDAKAAVDIGLADEIMWADDTCFANTAVCNAVGASIHAVCSSGATPSPADLRMKYESALANGASPAPGHDITVPQAAEAAKNTEDWRLKAALDLEKIRFI